MILNIFLQAVLLLCVFFGMTLIIVIIGQITWNVCRLKANKQRDKESASPVQSVVPEDSLFYDFIATASDGSE